MSKRQMAWLTVVVATLAVVGIGVFWSVLFGAGTWGAGGNMVAWVLCGGLAFLWANVIQKERHIQAVAQAARHHREASEQAVTHHREKLDQAERHQQEVLDRLEVHMAAIQADISGGRKDFAAVLDGLRALVAQPVPADPPAATDAA